MNIQMIGSAKFRNASCIVRMPEIANMIGASIPVIPSGTHSVIHHTTIQSIVPRANCGANVGTELSTAAFAMLLGTGVKIMATNSKGRTMSPMFSFLDSQLPLLSLDRNFTPYHHIVYYFIIGSKQFKEEHR
jgi:hypothetical protein